VTPYSLINVNLLFRFIYKRQSALHYEFFKDI
jgi:hypothetical protein